MASADRLSKYLISSGVFHVVRFLFFGKSLLSGQVTYGFCCVCAGLSNVLRDLYARVLVPGRANLPLAEPVPEPEREATPEVAPATPRPEVPVEEPGTAEQRIPEPEPEVPVGEPRLEVDEPAEEPYVELPVMEPPVETQPETQPEAGLIHV